MTRVSAPDSIFRRGLSQGEINLQKCRECDRYIFFPRIVCPHCGSQAYDWRAASGAGAIHTTTVVRQRADRGGDYNICMVELAEGVRMMSRVEGVAPEEVRIGMAVTVFVGDIDGAPAVLCRPTGARP